MTLQASGQISWNDIKTEFSGAAEIKASDYYRGGIYVPDTAANAGVPTSGEIKPGHFYGADVTSFTVNITPANISADKTGLNIATASIAFESDGDIICTNGTNYTWGLPNTAGVGAQYKIKYNHTSGSKVPIGITSTYAVLDANRTLSLASGYQQNHVSTGTITIANLAETVLDTVVVDLEVITTNRDGG